MDFKDDTLHVTVKNRDNDFVQKLKLKNFKTTDTLQVSLNKNSTLDFRDDFFIKVNTPIEKLDESKFILTKKDSTNHPFKLSIANLENKLKVDFEKLEDERFNLTLLPGAITDFYGKVNDTLTGTISTKKHTEYGNLNLVVNNAKYSNYIVQLLDDKENIKYEMFSTGKNEYYFVDIIPNKYIVRIVYDLDGNKKWTPGDYLKKRLPEEVIYFPQLIDVRANWDVNQPIDL